MKWRLIQSGHLDGYTNMAIDEAMFALSAANYVPATLRLYGWSPPAISIGYFQNYLSPPLIPLPPLLKGGRGDLGFPLIKGEGRTKERDKSLKLRHDRIDIVRRLTGGGAILHDRELTFCLVTAFRGSIIPDDIFDSYNLISGAVIKGLQILGIEAQIRGDETALSHVGSSLSNRGSDRAVSKQREFFCFARQSGYDIIFDGKKLVGSAQRRKDGILLHHGSILLDGEQNPETSIGVNSILGKQVDFKEISKNIVEGFCRTLSIDLIPGELTEEELELSRQLVMTKYNKRTMDL